MTLQASTEQRERPSPRLTVGAPGRILVVHPASATIDAGNVVVRLRRADYDVVSLPLRRSVAEDVASDDPDVVVITYRPGAFDLIRLCHTLRDTIRSRIVVIVVAGENDDRSGLDEDVIVAVLDAGADDCLPASASAQLIAARLRVAMRARPTREKRSQAVTVGDVVIDVEGHTVTAAGEVVKCPPLQFQLLLALAREAGAMVPRDRLLAELWGGPVNSVDPRRLRIAVSVLRGVLGEGPRRPVIDSVWGFGYRLIDPEAPGSNGAG